MSEKIKLNIASGERKFAGFINIDAEESTKPDIICNILREPLPFQIESVDTIYFLHGLEHIPISFWQKVLNEFRRVLVSEGLLLLAYPEFEKCITAFLENKCGMRDFWRATLYGRQLYEGDYHVSPVITSELTLILKQIGYKNISFAPDDEAEYYTFLKAYKGVPFTHEDVLRKEVLKDVSRKDTRFKLL